MKIIVCASMLFSKEMQKIQKQLEFQGHDCILPKGVSEYVDGTLKPTRGGEGAKRKIGNDLIRKHYEEIKNGDAVLVLNYTRDGIENRVGGNSFLEMGFAYILRKPIFLLNPIPKLNLYEEEIIAMQPIILHGDLSKIN